jgi:TPR repeat protein
LFPSIPLTDTPLLNRIWLSNGTFDRESFELGGEAKTFVEDVKQRMLVSPEKRPNFGRNDAHELALHWYLMAAEHGETMSQAEIGQNYWWDAFRFATMRNILKEYLGASPQTRELRGDYINGLQEVCRKAIKWLTLAASSGDSRAEAKADFYLWFVYTLGNAAKSSPPTDPGGQMLVLADCYPTDPAADRYLKRAAELGDGEAASGLMNKYKEAGDLDKAHYWGQRALERALADRDAGIPQPCIDNRTCHDEFFGTASPNRSK